MMTQTQAPNRITAHLGHPANENVIEKQRGRWFHKDTGEPVSDDEFRAGWHPLDCGAEEGKQCRIANAEAGQAQCPTCRRSKEVKWEAVEMQGRSNYCSIIGHDWSLDRQGDDLILRCSNRCPSDNNYKVVKREQ